MTRSHDHATMGGYAFHEGDRLRKAREELELSQEDVAYSTGISRATISTYERGGKVKRAYRNQLALALSVTTHWLETGEIAESGGDDGIPADINRRNGAKTGYRKRTADRRVRRASRPLILPPPGIHEHRFQEAA